MAHELGFRKDDILTNGRLYHADENQLLREVQAQGDEAGSLMLFGHNPGLTEFATLLCRHPFGNVPTCGVVCIDFAVDRWGRVAYHQGVLRFYDYPKKPEGEGSSL